MLNPTGALEEAKGEAEGAQSKPFSWSEHRWRLRAQLLAGGCEVLSCESDGDGAGCHDHS